MQVMVKGWLQTMVIMARKNKIGEMKMRMIEVVMPREAGEAIEEEAVIEAAEEAEVVLGVEDVGEVMEQDIQ